MKRRSLQPIPNPLCLSGRRQNLIIVVREKRTGRQGHTSAQPVQDDPLDHRPFVRQNERRSGDRAESANGALPRLLAAGFCNHLPERTLGGRRAGFNPGFFRDAA